MNDGQKQVIENKQYFLWYLCCAFLLFLFLLSIVLSAFFLPTPANAENSLLYTWWGWAVVSLASIAGLALRACLFKKIFGKFQDASFKVDVGEFKLFVVIDFLFKKVILPLFALLSTLFVGIWHSHLFEVYRKDNVLSTFLNILDGQFFSNIIPSFFVFLIYTGFGVVLIRDIFGVFFCKDVFRDHVEKLLGKMRKGDEPIDGRNSCCYKIKAFVLKYFLI